MKSGLLLLFLLLALPGQAMAASVAAADQGGGYSGQVLEKVVKHWQPPGDVLERMIRVKVSIDSEGRLLRCEPLSSTASALGDKSICTAVREAGGFGTPPYAVPIEVFLTFWSGPTKAQAAPAPAPAPAKDTAQTPQAAQPAAAKAQKVEKADTPEASIHEQEADYIKKVKGEIGSKVTIPAKTPKGKYTVSVKVRITAKGMVSLIGLSKSCGRLELDQALTGAVSRTGLVAGSPFKKTREFNLAFPIQVP